MIRRTICLSLLALLSSAVVPALAEKIEVPDNAVSVKVGQELFISFTANGDGLFSPRTVPHDTGPDPVVTVQVTQSGPSRTLLVTNGYAKALNYRAVARIRGRRREVELPVGAVRSGMQAATTVGEPFDELLLFEFHLQS